MKIVAVVVCLSIALVKDAVAVKTRYLGCFNEINIELTGVRKTVIRTIMTHQHCNSFCFRHAYKYAATKNGNECVCGDLSEDEDGSVILPPPARDSLCNVPCNFNLFTRCGGTKAFSLYSTGIDESDPLVKDIDNLKVGCFDDSGANRILAHHKVDLVRTNSPKRCLAYCRSLGFTHAGVQYKVECHCGTAMITKPLVDGCDQPCSSNPMLECGGNWRLMVYSTETNTASSEIRLLGCYKTSEKIALISKAIPEITANKCIAYCFFQGLPYALISKGEKCSCSRVEPTKKRKLSEAECDIPCEGDNSQICGGENSVIAYETSSSGDPSLGRLEYCYNNQHGDLLIGPKLNLGKENSVAFCLSKCIAVGYSYAALTNATGCQCTQSLPSRKLLKMVPDYLCNIPCPRNELENCGGDVYTAVFRTGFTYPASETGNKNDKNRISNGMPGFNVEDVRGPNQGAGTDDGGEKTEEHQTGNLKVTTYHPRLQNIDKVTTTAKPAATTERFTMKKNPWSKFSQSKIAESNEYMGCYSDDRGDVVFSENRTVDKSLTINQCVSFCFNKGYMFAAARNGNECHCGDLGENISVPDDDRQCNSPCLTNLRSRCGGKFAYSVYSTGILEDDVGDISKLEIGCIQDEDEIRLIREHKGDFLLNNSPLRCIAYCKRLGYPHAGLQYGRECFCGEARKTGPLVDGCSFSCPGDHSKTCGGNWRVNLYSTGVFDNSTDIDLNGCYHYDETSVITGVTIQYMTPLKCIAHCYIQGLTYAHIYNGHECLCGTRVMPLKLRDSMIRCNKPCEGDKTLSCGGERFMATYSTGVVGDPTIGRYESCYRDERWDLLSGPKFNLGNENSVQFCISKCIEQGFAYAGLRNKFECQCNQEIPKKSLKNFVDKYLCETPCPRIDLQYCGGPMYTALHRTGIISSNDAKNKQQAVDVLTTFQQSVGNEELTVSNRQPTLPAQDGYLGCYKDSRLEVRLTGHQTSSRAMSVTSCLLLCFSMGFKYSATKDGKECYCGDLPGRLPQPDDDGLCNVQCNSDITSKCGGKYAFSFYSTGISEDDLDLEDLEIGCLRDSDDTRLLPEHKVDLALTNTPKRCIAYCRALGYTHAGVQYSLECYCGAARKLDGIVDGCDKPCAGDQSQLCGGDWKANVYATGITKPPPGVSPKGCYWFNSTLIVTKKKIPYINQNRCASLCYLQHFPMSYVYNGSECLCGHTIPTQELKAPVKRCDIECTDTPAKCGGSGVMSAYTTGIIKHPSLGKLIGCFKDDSNDLLVGPKTSLGAANNIQNCIGRCMETGFAYAGLRNTFECQCTQIAPKRTPVRIVPDYECATSCPGSLQTCGAPLFTSLHRTGITPSKLADCTNSISKANGKAACGGQTLLLEEFDTLDTNRWEHTVKISGDDAEFTTYTKKKKNIDVENGKLVIRPTLITSDSFIKRGNLNLKGCTGKENSGECVAQGASFNILPPTESGQICTRRSFNFRYGIITVRAKFPKGDWVIPQIWLKPVKYTYGEGYRSGKMIIAMSRGNSDLQGPEGNQIGSTRVESGYQVSSDPYQDIKSHFVDLAGADPFYKDYHNYSITWTDDTILFYVDNNVLSGLKTLYRFSDRSLLEEMGLQKEMYWKNGTLVAPFDQDFYLCVGLSVGGIRDFPDDSVSSGIVKPWKNGNARNRLDFYLNRNYWMSSWSQDTKFEIDYIKITAY